MLLLFHLLQYVILFFFNLTIILSNFNLIIINDIHVIINHASQRFS